jgi:small-conductance mechanosensitive channel
VLDRSEIDMRILNLEEQAWQRRYELLKAEIDYAELDLWKEEADDVIEKIESGIHLEQSHQNGVQTQILSIEKQLAEEGLDPVIKQHLETRLSALQKLTERGDEFISVLLGASETEQRLADEINLKRSRFSFQEILEELWSKIEGLWQIELWVIDERSVTVKKVVVALIILIVGMILARIVTRSLSKRLPASRLDQSSRAAIEKVLYYFALLFLVLFALRTVNIPLTVFTFLGGAVAIGIGFGAQNLINNFISGFILMMERPVKIGDLIEVDNNFGVIEGIGARCTQIRTGANVHILVPNSSFLEKNIINWTLSDKKIRAHITVGVIYGADTSKVRDLMIQAVEEHEKVLKYPEPFVLFSEFGDNALIFEVYFWIRMQRIMERRRIESALRFRIDDLFREADLVIAFPQRDVHLDTTKPLDLRILKDKDERDP